MRRCSTSKCTCGRSPTGNCIGWHKLTEEEYKAKTKEEKEKIIKEAFEPRAIDGFGE